MRWTRAIFLGFGMTILALAGCQNSPPRFTPPTLKEDYILPPQDDPRFSNPPVYPKEVMDVDNMRKDNNPNGKFGGPGTAGMGKAAPTPTSGGGGF
jgi:hypothetical protein